ncbi:putative MATE family efflux protein [Oceanotoga teriensis]|uniref:MATE family efflux protein n=1 Tax=Oceanotoga teriensis TaxID=515440 RepID=A0AA45C7H5_9BACT|nr:MATE family efflux transporter [Oceanotoga teriensis]PWJ95310.1 putative MATE family efflux protein [Oceanotoga teriensis]
MSSFYKRLFYLALPIAIQQLISTGVNFIDTLMMGQLGDIAIAAVGQANRIFFLFSLLMFGISSAGSIFISQYHGKSEKENISKTTSLMFIFAFLASLIFFIPAYFKPEFVMSFFSPDSEVINAGKQYLKLVSISYPIMSIIFVFETAFKSTEHTTIPMISSSLAMGINIILNYIFIFGKFGVPQMNEAGAAIGTLFARIVQAIFLVYYIIKLKHPAFFKFKSIKYISKDFVIRFIKHAAPVTGNEFLWAAGVTAYSIIFANISTEVIAAKNIVDTIEQFIWAFLFALGSSTAIIIGKELGASRFEEAQKYSKKLIKLNFIFSIILILLLISILPFILKAFNVSQEVKQMIKTILYISFLFIPLRSFNLINGVGILRAGGDTKIMFYTEIITLWGLGVTAAFISGIILKLDYYWVYLLTMLDEIAKAIILGHRYLTKKWVKNVIN